MKVILNKHLAGVIHPLNPSQFEVNLAYLKKGGFHRELEPDEYGWRVFAIPGVSGDTTSVIRIRQNKSDGGGATQVIPGWIE